MFAPLQIYGDFCSGRGGCVSFSEFVFLAGSFLVLLTDEECPLMTKGHIYGRGEDIRAGCCILVCTPSHSYLLPVQGLSYTPGHYTGGGLGC